MLTNHKKVATIVITVSHGKRLTITMQVSVTNIEQKSSNAVQEGKDCKSNTELCRRVISNKDIIFPIDSTDIYILGRLNQCFIQHEWITKSSWNHSSLRNFISTRPLNFCFALKTSTGSKSKDGSIPLEDFHEAERLLEWVEFELEGGDSLREGGKAS